MYGGGGGCPPGPSTFSALEDGHISLTKTGQVNLKYYFCSTIMIPVFWVNSGHIQKCWQISMCSENGLLEPGCGSTCLINL